MSSRKGRAPKKNARPNIYDVAKRARVSVFTVSSVINKSNQVSMQLRRRVETAIRELNYRPNLLARSLARQQTHTIGIVVPDISNPFFPLVVRGAEDVAQNAGYSVLLCNTDNQREKEEQYLELLLSKRVDGILLTKAHGSFNQSQRRLLSNSNIPIALMMRTIRSFKADSVVTDDFQGAFEAVSHLARLDYHRIGFVSGPLDVSNGRARWQGYRKALRTYNLPFDPNLVIEGDYRVESGYRAGLALLSRLPDAIYVANYLMTTGFMKAAEETGLRCPEDFGLVSFDDYPWLGCFHPRLTTVDLPKYELGGEAARILIERIKGGSGPPINKKLQPRLIVRESCGFATRARQVGVKAWPPHTANQSGVFPSMQFSKEVGNNTRRINRPTEARGEKAVHLSSSKKRD